MVNMPAEVRCTSSGALSTDGSASARISVTAAVKPRTPAQNTIQAPCIVIMPIRLTSASAPVAA